MLQAAAELTTGAQNIIVLATATSHEVDGIHDYTRQLAAALSDRDDVHVIFWNPRTDSVKQFAELQSAGEGSLIVLLQYNPFNFGRWGFAPWLPAKLWRLKHSKSRAQLGLMVHETYFPIKDWRSAIIGLWQRIQFFAVRVLSDVIFTSIAAWAEHLETCRPFRPVGHLPVGSNIPDMRHERERERQRLGAGGETIVLAAFGSNHPSRLMGHVIQAAAAVADMGCQTMLLNLGSNVPQLDSGPGVEVVTPGRLEAADVGRHLAAADIYLAPFIDGASTRRTTLMAGLQHGLPVVATDGPLTDPVLRDADATLRLTPVDDAAGFARATRELAVDPSDRSRRGELARALYEREFDWPVVSAQLVGKLAERGDED